MKRRRWLAAACAHCAGWGAGSAVAQEAPPVDERWAAPTRFTRPELSSDEGGLWAMMDREETRLRRSSFLIRDAALRDYLQGIACKLGADHCPDVRVYPVRTPYFNASMAPNGMMQVWSGLLLRVDNEAQLAAILGHEMGHYLRRHTVERLRDAKARSSFSMFMGLFGVVGLLGQLGALAGLFGFSRDQEREADRIGLLLMRRAGYDPREAAKVWDNLRAELAATPGGDPTSSSPMFASHPPSDERSQTLTELAAKDSGGFVGASELGSRLAALQHDMLDDELRRGQPAETQALLGRLIERSPQRGDLRYFRGESRRLRDTDGDAAAALADFAEADRLGGAPPALYRAWGGLHHKAGRNDAARDAWRRYLELAPGAPDAALVRAHLNELGEKST
ncbi:MAG: M48 family metallopeptidase [Burkholderiales bacterium]|nr:M48 family metallopeptidase [Burkholderiales bacterium]